MGVTSIRSGFASSRSGRGLSSTAARKRRNASQPVSAIHGMRLCRHRHGGEFRDVAVLRDEPSDAAAAEPRGQPVDETIELGGILLMAEADLLGRQRFGGEHREPREIEAEAGIELVAERGQPLDEQFADRVRIAHRPRRAGVDAAHRAVGAEQPQLHAARAFAAALQHDGEPRRQPLRDGEHVLLARNRLGERLLGKIRRHRQARTERLAFAPERAIELAQQIVAETRRQRAARQIDDVGDALEADALEHRDGIVGKPQRRERQRGEQRALGAGCDDPRLGKMRRRPGGADRVGDGGAHREAEARQSRDEIAQQRLFAAEQMRAAADVEQQPVGSFGRQRAACSARTSRRSLRAAARPRSRLPARRRDRDASRALRPAQGRA